MAITLQPGQQLPLNVQLTPLPVEPATLYGKVTNAETGGNVVGAVVQISGDGGTYSDTTNSSGNYQINNIEPGTYDGLVTHPDYEDKTF